MAKILVLPSEVVDKAESGNSYAFPADNIIMSDKATSVEEAINNKPGEKTDGGGEIFNDASNASTYAHAEGYSTIATGTSSHAEGDHSQASGEASHAEGYWANASGASSHAEGNYTVASGDSSHAEGYQTLASSDYQHVQGKYNIEDSNGVYAHIVGWGTGNNQNRANIHTITTTGDGWFAGTVKGEAGLGFSDFSIEQVNSVTGGTDQTYRAVLKYDDASVSNIDHTGNGWFAGKVSAGSTSVPAEPTEDNDLTTKKYVDENGVGKKTDSGGEIFNNATDANMDSHAEGVETTASGTMSHAEGNLTTASGNISHAEGSHTTASGLGSHAEGSSSDAIGNYSHAEGRETEAGGVGSHAEGYQSNASGDYSHAEGSGIASGDYSHAEGASFATGNYSHAEGIGNTAYTEAQHVEGKYSEPDSEGLYAHIIGWGASDGDRKNINTIDTNGNGWFAGTVEGANGIKVGPSIITYNEDNQMITFNFE